MTFLKQGSDDKNFVIFSITNSFEWQRKTESTSSKLNSLSF